MKRKALDLLMSKYCGFGPTLAQEKLVEVEGLKISDESVRRILCMRKLMMVEGLWKAKKVRKADRFPTEVDFLSIGTNDLTQYTLAAKRGNKRVSYLNDPCHPAVLLQIERVAVAAHRAGIWVGVCGEMAGDMQAIPLLLGLGIDELSITPAQIPVAKQLVRALSLIDVQKLAQQALDMDSSDAVRQAIQSWKIHT